ncbi:hypothetical protein BDR22DRAFT_866691 [Usnea florida]
MHFSAFATLLVASSATIFANPLEKRFTNEKANEYASPNCEGPINYGHRGFLLGLGNVNMDPTSHSVYLAGATWTGWSENSGDGNGGSTCGGSNLGTLGRGCRNLDTALSSRINCVLDN